MHDTVRYSPLPFTSAAHFIETFDPSLRSGKKTLHPWQREMLDFLSDTTHCQNSPTKRPRFTIAEKLKLLLCAANGSGKDAFIIAGFCVFVLCCWQRYKIVATSSSAIQLDSQTRSYIKNLCIEVNSYLKHNGILDDDAITIRADSFESAVFDKEDGSKFTMTASRILTFVTDEGGRAEGHHPWPDALDGEGVIIIVNEGKSVPDEIYGHLQKCTYNYWIEVSSAGEASQHFYNALTSARDWVDGWVPNEYIKRKITSYDCPHKPLSSIEADKLEHGEESEFFQTTHLSNFIASSGSVVITEKTMNKCLATAKTKIDVGLPIRAGLDLGAGGDPCCLSVFDNNVQIGLESWTSRDTEATVDILCGTEEETGLFDKYGLAPENIFGDDNGLGQPILDGCARRAVRGSKTLTWSVVRIRNQSTSADKSKYLNRGIELYVRFARLVEQCIVVLMPDAQQQKELTSRHYDYNATSGKRKLLSKPEEKALGHASPNRADATVLAFTGLTITDFYDGKQSAVTVQPRASIPTQTELAQGMTRTGAGHNVAPAAQDWAVVYANYHRDWLLGDDDTANKAVRFSNPVAVQQSLYK